MQGSPIYGRNRVARLVAAAAARAPWHGAHTTEILAIHIFIFSDVSNLALEKVTAYV
jgi:hypothetical protein